MIVNYKVHELTEYINWIYFFHAWGFAPRFSSISALHGCDSCRAGWLASFPQEERAKASEAMQLFKEANRMLNQLDEDFTVRGVVELWDANSDGDNLIIGGKVLPLLRQQSVKQHEGPFLCLSDFVHPLESGVKDMVGVFATTVDEHMLGLYPQDPYKQLLIQTLSDRLAEAAAERLHQHVRKELWGYAKDENLCIKDLLEENYQGIRPAVGYPSLPDQSVVFILNSLLEMERIGISLTENGAMHPHASVCGLMFSHPASRYFNIGKIGSDQLADYAKRRGLPQEEVKKFLSRNL